MKKRVIWKNDIGMEIVFDNRRLFFESIDMTGTAGVHTVESLASSDGQTTLAHQIGAKTIPCSFALMDRYGDRWLQKNLPLFFSPAIDGTLIVDTESDRYTIRCYPQNIPVFKRSEVPYIWRFDVDFVADFPYWSMGKRTLELEYPTTVIESASPIKTPVKISFPTNGATPFNINGKGFTLLNCESPLTVDTRDFSVRDAQGIDRNNYIDATAPLDKIFLRYGENMIFCPNYQGVVISYDILSMGEL